MAFKMMNAFIGPVIGIARYQRLTAGCEENVGHLVI
jgi:hypothetical protein